MGGRYFRVWGGGAGVTFGSANTCESLSLLSEDRYFRRVVTFGGSLLSELYGRPPALVIRVKDHPVIDPPPVR